MAARVILCQRTTWCACRQRTFIRRHQGQRVFDPVPKMCLLVRVHAQTLHAAGNVFRPMRFSNSSNSSCRLAGACRFAWLGAFL